MAHNDFVVNHFSNLIKVIGVQIILSKNYKIFILISIDIILVRIKF